MTWKQMSNEPSGESWFNEKYGIQIRLYFERENTWRVSLGSGSFASWYNLIESKQFNSLKKAKAFVEHLKRKYEHGWM